ncbi:Eco57I restriction-modification methylase domain-containing protein [Roseitranquillus sediminis]|uniref:Eco57I restriction-modification methylase domain-containing protein n=1 Tax=Roseitranquillus sediminis TaxID=2809051 RepID=UPI001D0CB5EC|nr:N-6 DNA methylase [Roseitranquillus sediminis]MBM9593937.1 N-6 DNA methylase [Roseitranquillus sediminis]
MNRHVSGIALDGAQERTHSGRFTALDADKLRGGYYTSSELARWLCAWAIRDADELVLEPSCGDGAFLEAASARLEGLGAHGPARANHLRGIEINPDEADKARLRLRDGLGMRAADVVVNSDFFAWWSRPERPEFDVVIGNPPFIRYQSFPEPHRSRAMDIMHQQGLWPNRLTNIWVPFVVAAAAALKAGGRMALVLPAELLQVSYAAQLRSFLTDRFGRVDLIACNELFFEKAEQEVLLLLAEEARPAPSASNPCKVNLTESDLVADIVKRTPREVLRGASPKTVCHDSEKWLKYFLNADEISFMRALRAGETTTELGSYASVNVGVVTGKNQFFVLRESEVEQLGLQGYTMPLMARSAHLEGALVDKAGWRTLADEDQRVHLLHLAPINGTKPKGALASYIRLGEAQDVHKGYKCSVRTPWYAVPSVYVPDAFVFRQIYDFPRIVFNDAGATATDTIHRMRSRGADPRAIVANSYSYLSAASAEIVGRSYGGGVLELEPTEAEKLLMPATLGDALPLEECDAMIRAGRLESALDENSRRILIEGMGLSKAECTMLRGIWEKMRNRRLARRRAGKKPRGQG